MSLPRGLRNNNPGNIRITKDKWQGLREKQEDKSFFQFTEMKWGYRALIRTLQNYRKLMFISSYNINVNTPNARPTQSQMMSLIENSVFLQYLSYTSFRTKITTVIMIASHSGVYFDSHITKFWHTIM